MRKTSMTIATVFVLSLFAISTKVAGSAKAFFLTIVPLNTGYNHAVFAPYPAPTPVSTTQDNYWINIASYPPTTSNVAPSFAIQKAPSWQAPMTYTIGSVPAGSHWISARNTYASAPGTAANNPSYTIFRKCFCLKDGFKNAQLNFQVRADDNIQVWLNTQTNTVLAPAFGNPNSTPLSASTAKGFKAGKNCLYVLLEDVALNGMGFNLVGQISADNGLSEDPAAGTQQTFNCPCGPQPGPGSPVSNDRQVVQELVKIAEERRIARGGKR